MLEQEYVNYNLGVKRGNLEAMFIFLLKYRLFQENKNANQINPRIKCYMKLLVEINYDKKMLTLKVNFIT